MKILLIGCGNIGKILLGTWRKMDDITSVVVVQPSLSAQAAFKLDEQITFVSQPHNIDSEFSPDVVVMAIKPHHLEAALPHYRRFDGSTIFVSLAAGIQIDWLKKRLGEEKRVTRIMPNVAIRVGQSVNLSFAPGNILALDKTRVANAFAETGKLIWLEQEEWIELLTPISGSGPAYFFRLAAALIDYTVKQGVDRQLATEAVQQTLLGSALLAEKNADLAGLANSVASKGGVTEAALEVMDKQLPSLIHEAMDAAIQRLQELQQ